MVKLLSSRFNFVVWLSLNSKIVNLLSILGWLNTNGMTTVPLPCQPIGMPSQFSSVWSRSCRVSHIVWFTRTIIITTKRKTICEHHESFFSLTIADWTGKWPSFFCPFYFFPFLRVTWYVLSPFYDAVHSNHTLLWFTINSQKSTCRDWKVGSFNNYDTTFVHERIIDFIHVNFDHVTCCILTFNLVKESFV